MCKNDEVKFLEKWAASLPDDSYLALYFRDPAVQGEFAWCIRNDFGAPDLTGLRRMTEDHRASESQCKKELQNLQEHLAEQRRELATLQTRIAAARRAAAESVTALETLRGCLRSLSAASSC